MKAMVYDKSNGVDMLALREVETPTPRENEVLIRVAAASINAADYRSMRMGIIPRRKIFGADVAGRVVAAGGRVTTFKVGDAVFGDLSGSGFGGFAEYVAAPETVLALKPSGVSFVTAAALPMAAVTALQGLRDRGEIRSGQRVLIYGAGGGVGGFAVQLAKVYGAQVTALCAPGNIQMVRSLGADQVIDYSKEDFHAGGARFDLILAVNGSQPLSAYKRALAARGVLVVVGGGLGQLFKVMLFGWAHALGGKKMRVLAAKPNARDLEFIIRLVEQGKLTPVIDQIYPLEEAAAAVRYLSQGHARGKVVLLAGEV